MGGDPRNQPIEEIAWQSSKRSKGSKEKIPTAQITKAFQACLASKRPQQQLVADKFYEEINKWTSDQLDVDGQTIVVNVCWNLFAFNVSFTESPFVCII